MAHAKKMTYGKKKPMKGNKTYKTKTKTKMKSYK